MFYIPHALNKQVAHSQRTVLHYVEQFLPQLHIQTIFPTSGEFAICYGFDSSNEVTNKNYGRIAQYK